MQKSNTKTKALVSIAGMAVLAMAMAMAMALIASASLLLASCSKKQGSTNASEAEASGKTESSSTDLVELAGSSAAEDKAGSTSDSITAGATDASSANTGAADATEEDAEEMPKELTLPQGFDPFANHRSKVGSTCYTFPIFRVFGFSKDGKMAYSLKEDIDGRGGTIFTYIIQDLVTDKILWQIKDDTEDWLSDQAGSQDLSIEEVSLLKKKEELKAAMEKYGVTQSSQKFLQFPASNGYDCTADFQDKTNNGEDDWLGNIDYKITVKNSSGKSKTVASEKGAKAYQVVVCGYFKNPYENRLAIIYGEEKYVFEGTGITYHVAGCDLSEESFK